MFRFLGASRVDFNTQDGKHLDGYSFWFAEDASGESQVGLMPFKAFLNKKPAEEILLNDFQVKEFVELEDFVNRECEISFDRKGHPVAVSFAS